MRSPRRRSFAALVLLGVFAVACSGSDEGGVSVKTVATDLVYGIPPTPKPAPPANISSETTDPLKSILTGGDLPKVIPPPRGRVNLCPPTPPTVFPAEAPPSIKGVPKNGTYVWRLKGTQTLPPPIGKVSLPPFYRREVIDATKTEVGPRFTTEERELIAGSQYTIRSTYEYRVTGGVGDEVTEQSGAASPVDRTGLYLVKIERIHRASEEFNSEFNPSPPILVLPQPVELGAPVDSSGVDPVSLEVLRQSGFVTKRVRVDACGKPQDTFYVETFQEFVASDGRADRRRYDYGIATVMGGLPIIEHVESPCIDTSNDPQVPGDCQKDAVTFQMDAHIGQLEPD